MLTALDEVEKEAKRLLTRKPAPKVVPDVPHEDEPPPAQDEEFEPAPDEGSLQESSAPPATSPGSQRPPRPVSRLSSKDEAVARVVDAAHYLRRADPADPASYLVLRALQAAGLYQGGDALASGDLPPPATDVRERLYQLSRTADGEQWAELLDESEQAIGRPEGRGWLDPHCYSARALEALGYQDAARACKAIFSACLHDHEQWPASQMRDGTPCASGPTRDWIQRECQSSARPLDLGGEIRPPQLADIASSSDGSSSLTDSFGNPAEQPDPWEEAQALARANRHNEAISVMVQAVRQAHTGRKRFLRTLQQAELCLGSRRPDLALPLLEMLAQRIDDLRLDQWEDNSLCARVLSHLYRCLKGRDDARAAVVYNRLCQFDAGEALLLGGIG